MIGGIVFGKPTSMDARKKAAMFVLLRKGTDGDWTNFDPVLLNNEVGIDVTNNELRIGDGEKSWTELPVATPQDALNLLLGAHS